MPATSSPRGLDLAGVEPGTDLEAESADRLGDGTGTLDGPGRTVECGQGAVAGGLDVSAPEALELPLDQVSYRSSDSRHCRSPSSGQVFCGSHDVGEQDCHQDAIEHRHRPDAGEELLDLVEEFLGPTGERQVVVPGSSTNRAPGIRPAIWRPCSGRTWRSPRRLMTSVGAWMADSTGVTSLSMTARVAARGHPGSPSDARSAPNAGAPFRLDHARREGLDAAPVPQTCWMAAT